MYRIFLVFWHPITKREKQNQVTGHMKHAAMYGRHLYIALGKFMQLYKKIVIIKMNKML